LPGLGWRDRQPAALRAATLADDGRGNALFADEYIVRPELLNERVDWQDRAMAAEMPAAMAVKHITVCLQLCQCVDGGFHPSIGTYTYDESRRMLTAQACRLDGLAAANKPSPRSSRMGNLAGMATITGTDGPDNISGTDLNDLIEGFDGDDAIRGGAGDDTLRGNGGSDFIVGGAGADSIFGGKGDDFIFAGADDDTTDTLFGGVGNDNIHNNGVTDFTMDGGTIYAGEGDDKAWGDYGSDIIGMGAGNDYAYLYGGDDTASRVTETTIQSVIWATTPSLAVQATIPSTASLTTTFSTVAPAMTICSAAFMPTYWCFRRPAAMTQFGTSPAAKMI
jgi:hypothetical protein